jgi:hypothetical protein
VVLKLGVLLFALALAATLVCAAQREHQVALEQDQEEIPDWLREPGAESPASERPPSAEPASNRAPKNPYGIMGPSSKADPHMAREEAIQEAIQQGLLQRLGVDAAAKSDSQVESVAPYE